MSSIEHIIQDAVRGDAAAFRDLLDHYYSTIYKMAFTFCRNKHDAEDVTQICCLKLAKAILSFRNESSFTTWLYRVVFNCVEDWRRQNSKSQNVSLDDVAEMASGATPEQNASTAQKMKAVYALPDGERDAVLLVFGQGLSHKEAGVALGCKESTISWRIHEARKKLAQFSEEERRHGRA